MWVGFIFRIDHLFKPEGLWTDELASFYHAKQSTLQNFIFCMTDLTPPLYFVFLKFFINIFGEHDVSLRFLSVLFGIINIPVMYFAGKELGSKRTGLVAAALCSISSFLIYYSQEVRYYAFIALLATVSSLFVIKVLKNPDKKNLAGLIISNLAIMHTFTLGFVFVGIQAVCVSAYYYFKNRENLKRYVISQLITCILFIPFFIVLWYQLKILSAIPNFSAIFFSPVSVLAIFQNWFTPVANGFMNVTPDFYNRVLSGFPSIHLFVLFAVVPALICIASLVYGCIKNSKVLILVSGSLLFVLLEIIATLLGKFEIITRYTIIAYPAILLAISFGLTNIKNRFISLSLITILLSLNLYYLRTCPFSAPKQGRGDGFRPIGFLLEKYNFNKQDYLFTSYTHKFIGKYYADSSIVDANLYFFMNKKLNTKNPPYTMEELFYNKVAPESSKDQIKKWLRYYILYRQPLNNERFIKNEIISKLQKNRHLIVLVNRNISIFDSSSLYSVARDEQAFINTPTFFILSSKFDDDLLRYCYTHLKPVKVDSLSFWEAHIFKYE